MSSLIIEFRFPGNKIPFETMVVVGCVFCKEVRCNVSAIIANYSLYRMLTDSRGR